MSSPMPQAPTSRPNGELSRRSVMLGTGLGAIGLAGVSLATPAQASGRISRRPARAALAYPGTPLAQVRGAFVFRDQPARPLAPVDRG
jgi:hypothetical protein